jgi:hypothetical protein
MTITREHTITTVRTALAIFGRAMTAEAYATLRLAPPFLVIERMAEYARKANRPANEVGRIRSASVCVREHGITWEEIDGPSGARGEA